MGGGLMQLVAYGAQDIYLTGNPQITFFKVVYRRHTNFAVESIEQTFNGAANFGNKFSCTISRNGDLLHRVYLECDVSYTPDAAAGGGGGGGGGGAGGSEAVTKQSGYGFSIINNVEVEIGGQCIDKHYGDWMQIWTDLTHSGDKANMLNSLVDLPGVAATNATPVKQEHKLYVPLQFWFCRNPGLALPLIALQYHEVKLNVQFSTKPTIANVTATNHKLDRVCVFCDYIFLDTDERRRFAQVSHEYLIEQVQFSNALKVTGEGGQVELRFNHPVKELVWHTNNTANSGDDFDSCLLQLNGHDRFRKREGSYFKDVQRYEHHTGAAGASGAHMYSFALKPEEHQPSGTCNFSRIDNAVLSVEGTLASTTLKVYAVNYNVLRIMSGMGGLAYSN